MMQMSAPPSPGRLQLQRVKTEDEPNAAESESKYQVLIGSEGTIDAEMSVADVAYGLQGVATAVEASADFMQHRSQPGASTVMHVSGQHTATGSLIQTSLDLGEIGANSSND